MGFLTSRVVDFLGGPFEQVNVPAADVALSKATVDYTGEPVAKADWPDPMPRARVNVVDEARWRELAVHLVELGIFAVLSEDQLVRVRGEPFLNGLFAVEKKGRPGPGAERVTRLILNMVPGNALLKPHVGEASLLAASTNWVSLHIPEGKLLLWSGDHQKGAFFVWRIPKAWHPYMVVGRSLPAAPFGRPERQVFVAAAVIALGWMSAAPVFQRTHRRLRRLPPPRGAGLPPGLEWRKVYVDDFDAPEIADEVRARQLVGTEADCQQRVRESYERAGAACAAGEAHLRETRVERMGSDVDGLSGRLAAPRPQVLSTAALCLATLSQERVPRRVCMMVLGKLVRAFEFRRPLFGLLNSAWSLSTARSTVRCNAEMVEELLLGLMLLPAAATSLRARVEGMVTVSDASEFGGGVCASTSLRGEAASAFKSVGQFADHLGVGARLLNVPVELRCPWPVSSPRVPRAVVLKVLNVLVVGLFDGIGGLSVSLSRLPVRIVAYVAAETDAKARRVVRLRWSGAIDWGDVARVDENLVQDLLDTFSETVGVCVAGAGSPCQELSRLNASGGGLHGRKGSLFYEVPRIFRLLQQALGRRFYSLLENVANMTDENVKAMSSSMGVKPYFICSSVMVPCRRPRFFWRSWQFQVTPPLRLVDRGYYIEVVTDNGPLLDIEWEDQGFRWAGRPLPFPTLVCCRLLPSSPSAPRGLASASSEARARWQADSFRYHVALCVEKHPAQDCSGKLPGRLPSCTWRERLLGFDEGCAAVATEGSNPLAASDAGAFLLGNSFSVYVVAWALQRVRLIARVGQCRETWGQRGCFEDSAGDPNTEETRSFAAIVTKGRSSSRRLQPALRRWMAMAIAADMCPLTGYVVSGGSPADEPSRKLWRGSRLRKRGEEGTRAVQDLLRHCGASPQEVRNLGDGAEDADSLVASYLEAIWQSGAGWVLSWALLEAWRRAEPAERALPFTPDIVAGMAGLAAEAGAFDVSCLLLISFDGPLRGGEDFALTTDDVLDRGDSVVLRIRTSMTTAGKDAAEAVAIRSAVAKAMLRLVVQQRPAGEALSWRSPAQLRGALGALARGLGRLGRFSWHSARRGGASDFFLRSASMGATLVKGRWASSMTAGIRVEGAVADLARVGPT
ncbi:unnamed protein product, partial [Prorocentrum cordatum]